jgi:hypothetical protein
MSKHYFDWGIKTLREMDIEIPDCVSIEEYYSALEGILPIYANQPGKLYWIYGEMRMVKIKEYNESGTELQKLMCLCHVANRFLSNRPIFLKGNTDKRSKDLYKRLDTIEVIAAPKNARCSKCRSLDGKKYRIMQDFMGGEDALYNNSPTFKIPPEISFAMDSCTDEIGCRLLLG